MVIDINAAPPSAAELKVAEQQSLETVCLRISAPVGLIIGVFICMMYSMPAELNALRYAALGLLLCITVFYAIVDHVTLNEYCAVTDAEHRAMLEMCDATPETRGYCDAVVVQGRRLAHAECYALAARLSSPELQSA